MHLKFKNKKITGILSVLPENEVHFADGIKNYKFPENKSLKLAKIMGYGTTRIASKDTCVSDLCIYGLEHLFAENLLNKDDIDALILVTQTPDYFLPATSNIIAGAVELGEDVFCVDINQGCAGYEVGLMQAYMLLDQDSIETVVLLNADVLSKKVSLKDRNSRPLVGDGASITVIKNDEEAKESDLFIKMDGRGAKSLIIPAGGFRLPSSEETRLLKDDGSGNMRSDDHLKMIGDDVFNFVQTKIPQMVSDIYEKLKISDDDLDFYFFHQPNKFMLEKLADKIKVERSKMPNNIVGKYGNGSGITVPLNICENLGDKSHHNTYQVILGGFGVGLTWSMIVCELKMLSFCKIINYKE
ncbi:MAG: 3-oxoacyl-[acyl-carrier-protein] synthase-3 [Polaribacter sp.]|jgi:3-oxoacyl-[acyl-carrier-protein] synthase-3